MSLSTLKRKTARPSLAELVKCVICMKTFTSPQTLTCLHTFCKHCLENHAKRSCVNNDQGVECPQCKQFTAQIDISTCIRTEQLVELAESSKERKICGTEHLEWKCKVCAAFYCGTCKEMHSKTDESLENQKLVGIDDLSDEELFLFCTANCSTQKTTELDSYCFDCDILVCSPFCPPHLRHYTVQPPVLTQPLPYKKSVFGNENFIEKIDFHFHSRYQPTLTKAQLESATVTKSVGIDLGRDASGYRINVGFGKIVVCFWYIATIVIYNTDGTKLTELDLSDKVYEGLATAAFVSSHEIVVVADGGLYIFNWETSALVQTISEEMHSDVVFIDERIFALKADGFVCIIERQNGDWTIIQAILLDLKAIEFEVDPFASIAITPNCIYYCNTRTNDILQFNFTGELQQTLIVDEFELMIANQDRQHAPANEVTFLCGIDENDRMVLSVDGQMVLQLNNQSEVVKLDGMPEFLDMAFENQHTFWLLDTISSGNGEYELVKYTIQMTLELL